MYQNRRTYVRRPPATEKSMNLLLTIRVALRALAKNKLRAGLTVLGVVIGIAAVTTMVSIGESAGALVQGQLQNLGTRAPALSPIDTIVVTAAMVSVGES